MHQEEWRPVEGWPYEVSSLGRIKRAKPGGAAVVGRILKPRFARAYVIVALQHEGHRKEAYVHHLVATAFLGPRPFGSEVNHMSTNKADNSATNLEYLTPTKNRLHAHALGLTGRVEGQHHGMAKLRNEDIADIRASTGSVTNKALAERLGLHPDTISRIRLRKLWRHLP